MAIKIRDVMRAVENNRGFMRADELFRTLHGREPKLDPKKRISELHDFVEELEDISVAAKRMVDEELLDNGVTTVSFRRRGSIGVDDKVFVKAEMPTDVRAKRTRKTQERYDKDGNLIVPKSKDDIKDYIPGVAIVEPSWYGRKEDAEDFRKDFQGTLSENGIDATVRSVNPAVVDNRNGYFVTLFVEKQ